MTPQTIAAKLALSENGRKLAAIVAVGLFTLLMLMMLPFFVILGGVKEAVDLGLFDREIAGRPVAGPFAVGLPTEAQEFWDMYVDAGEVFGVSPFLLMAVHEDETNFSRSQARGVRTGVNFANCCAGPMQFYIFGGATPAQGGSGATWGATVNGSPLRNAYQQATIERPQQYTLRIESPHPNVYDSYDAIYAAAKYFQYLKAGPELDEKSFNALVRYKGSPPASIPFAQADYDRALEFQQVYLENGGFEAAAPTGETVMAKRPERYLQATRDGFEPNLSEWLAPIDGFPNERCDRRILGNVLWLIREYRLVITDCYSTTGVHRSFGEHPLGLGVDAVPAPNGSWALVGELARWAEPVQDQPRAPFRWVGYNGDAAHGDPAHAGGNAHIHLSWNHAPTPWNYPAEWVTVWR